MSSGTFKNIKTDVRYNYQHIYFVSKKRRRVFKKQKTIDACREAFYEATKRFGFEIRELGFGEDFAHVHMIVDVPSQFSVQQTIQIFKSHGASKIFEKVPNFLKLYPDREFWSGWRYNGSTGPMTEHGVIGAKPLSHSLSHTYNVGSRLRGRIMGFLPTWKELWN